jgi:phosphoglucosamine mutase
VAPANTGLNRSDSCHRRFVPATAGQRVVGARAATAPEVLAASQTAAELLGDTGRILLRPSGTEQLVRVMVEAPTEELARQIAERVAALAHAASPATA